jgi:glutathione S-transferase
MPDIIFHHYPASPFSEKIRRIFGYKQLPWRSVEIPRMAPKPDLMPLTGGYRRTPVMQIGADIYCDTACIARELDRRFPEPSLFPGATRGMAAIVAAWADRALFFDAVGCVFGTLGDTFPAEFREDRKKFSGGMFDADKMKANLPHARQQLRSHLFWVERALDDGRAFVLGEAASLADFAIYNPTWFITKRLPDSGLLDGFARIQSWLARMDAFGIGTPTPMDAKEALQVAKAAQPDALHLSHPEAVEGWKPGDPVTVAADDYGRDPVAGTLLGLSAQNIVIRRVDPQVGELNLHFPRAGFRIARAEA